MSVKILTRVWDDESLTNRTELLMMLAIADNCNDDGCCYPGIKTLANKTRLSERGTYKLLEELEAKKYLRRETKASKYKTNIYQVYPEPGCRVNGFKHPEPGCRVQKTNRSKSKELLENGLESECDHIDPEPGCRMTLNRGAGKPSEEPLLNRQSNNIEEASEEVPPPKHEASAHKELIAKWSAAYKVQFGIAYLFEGGRDGKGVKRLLSLGVSPDVLIEKAKLAWTKATEKEWNASKLDSLHWFGERFNQINRELKRIEPREFKL